MIGLNISATSPRGKLSPQMASAGGRSRIRRARHISLQRPIGVSFRRNVVFRASHATTH